VWIDGQARARRRRWRVRAKSSLVSRLRARHRRLLLWRLPGQRVSSAGRRRRRVGSGRHHRQRRHERPWRHHRSGRNRRRRVLRRSRVHEQRDLRAPELWRHGSALQSGPRRRPVPDGMDLQGVLQHFPYTGARLRGATVHAARCFLHHAARIVRRHRHVRVPSVQRVPDRRRVRPHQQRTSHLSVGLTSGLYR